MSLIRFGVLLTNILIGTTSNGFIVLVICIDWVRIKRLSPTDLILSCLGLSRFLWEVVVILNAIMISFFEKAYILNEVQVIMNIMWVFTNTVSLWFAAWLSVLYFVKIAIFSHPVFLQMKQGFSRLVPWLLLGSVLFSALTTIILITIWFPDFSICNFYRSLLSNSSDSGIKILNCDRYLSILSAAPNFIPIAIFLSSSIFLIISLWKYIRQVQCNGTGIKDLNTQVHLTAIKVLVSFAVLYLSSFVAVTLRSLLDWRSDNWMIILLETVGLLYPSGHAIIMIIINPKLKQAWMQILHHLKCHLTETSS